MGSEARAHAHAHAAAGAGQPHERRGGCAPESDAGELLLAQRLATLSEKGDLSALSLAVLVLIGFLSNRAVKMALKEDTKAGASAKRRVLSAGSVMTRRPRLALLLLCASAACSPSAAPLCHTVTARPRLPL